jgi:transposase
VARADRDEGRRSDGVTSADREELVRLSRELRVARLEVEILKRAAAYFAQENVLPK